MKQIRIYLKNTRTEGGRNHGGSDHDFHAGGCYL